MDCGIPFCHEGCPLGNLIPEWNDLVYKGEWRDAADRLHATNNFPEFTGRLCPAPCEASCVLGINSDPVTIERIEYEISERAWSEGWVTPVASGVKTGKSVAVVGSGPAGLACAQQLARAGHKVTVFERAEMPGGLLRYGIPEFKMEKAVLDRRFEQLAAEGVEFRCGVSVGHAVRVPVPYPNPVSSAEPARPAPRTYRSLAPRDLSIRTTPWFSPAGPPCRGSSRCGAVSSTGAPRSRIPEALEPRPRRSTRRDAHRRKRKARRDNRRGRHGR